MEKIDVAKGLASELHETERAVDAAILQATRLITTMIEARQELNLSAVVGAEAQAKAMGAVAALSEAREALVASHGDLAIVQRKVGLGAVAIGPLDKPEEDGPVHGNGVEARRRLRVAASQ